MFFRFFLTRKKYELPLELSWSIELPPKPENQISFTLNF